MRTFGQLMLDFILRSCAMAASLVLFDVLDWELAVRLSAYSTATALSQLCDIMPLAHGIGITCDNQTITFGKMCTYLDLFFITAPFVWRVRQPKVVNLRNLLMVLSLIWLLNAVRLVVGLSAYLHGVSWQLAHDLPDLLIYWPFLGITLMLYWHHVAAVYLFTGEEAEQTQNSLA